MLVWLASIPRSGNTLFRICLHHYLRVPTYSVWNDKVFFENGVDDVMGQKRLPVKRSNIARLVGRDKVYFVKTHGYNVDTIGRSIYIVRDPRSVIVSFSHYRVWKRKHEDVHQAMRWIIDNVKWRENATWWLERCEAVVKFEDLLLDPFGEVCRVVTKMELPLSPKEVELPAFSDLHKRLPDFFRRGKNYEWQKALPLEFQEEIWSKVGDIMERLGYVK